MQGFPRPSRVTRPEAVTGAARNCGYRARVTSPRRIAFTTASSREWASNAPSRARMWLRAVSSASPSSLAEGEVGTGATVSFTLGREPVPA